MGSGRSFTDSSKRVAILIHNLTNRTDYKNCHTQTSNQSETWLPLKLNPHQLIRLLIMCVKWTIDNYLINFPSKIERMFFLIRAVIASSSKCNYILPFIAS